MTNKIEYLRREIEHVQRLIDASNRAAEENKSYESLMMIFVNQAERLEDEKVGWENKLKEELALQNKAKPLKGKKNAKARKKRSRRA